MLLCYSVKGERGSELHGMGKQMRPTRCECPCASHRKGGQCFGIGAGGCSVRSLPGPSLSPPPVSDSILCPTQDDGEHSYRSSSLQRTECGLVITGLPWPVGSTYKALAMP